MAALLWLGLGQAAPSQVGGRGASTGAVAPLQDSTATVHIKFIQIGGANPEDNTDFELLKIHLPQATELNGPELVEACGATDFGPGNDLTCTLAAEGEKFGPREKQPPGFKVAFAILAGDAACSSVPEDDWARGQEAKGGLLANVFPGDELTVCFRNMSLQPGPEPPAGIAVEFYSVNDTHVTWKLSPLGSYSYRLWSADAGACEAFDGANRGGLTSGSFGSFAAEGAGQFVLIRQPYTAEDGSFTVEFLVQFAPEEGATPTDEVTATYIGSGASALGWELRGTCNVGPPLDVVLDAAPGCGLDSVFL